MKPSTAIIIVACGAAIQAAAVWAQVAPGAVVPAPSNIPMSFFVTSTVPGTGNLGGLEGADRICQSLAAAAGAGNRTWRAYMSTEARGNIPAVNARDRIGNGPWYNSKGVLIAANLADLHGDVQRDRNNIRQVTALTEKGDVVPSMPNQHDMMTGSDSQGRAFGDGSDHACNNWTSESAMNRATVGHSDRQGGGNTSWNSSHLTRDCTREGIIAVGGGGRFYCFAQ